MKFVSESDKTHPDVSGEISYSEQTSSSEITELLLGSAWLGSAWFAAR